jgi:hypothetical protein
MHKDLYFLAVFGLIVILRSTHEVFFHFSVAAKERHLKIVIC